MTPDPAFDELSPAESIYAEWLDRGESREPFADLCRERPEAADELRVIHAALSRLDRELPADAAAIRDIALERTIEALHARTPAGRYRTIGVLGRGGMGEVLEVEDTILRVRRAKKVVLGSGALSHGSRDVTRLRRFVSEAETLSRLDHPGIVPILDWGVDEDRRLFYVMPIVSGHTLAEVLGEARARRGGRSRERILGELLKVCDAVAYAHGQGILHRDLTPRNVKFGEFGRVTVLDWGLSKTLAATDTEPRTPADPAEAAAGPSAPRTLQGIALGTLPYCSPEQARGDSARVDARADVYALGAILYELLSGAPPYLARGENVTSDVLRERVLGGPPPELERVARDAPAELAAICRRAMERDAGARYATVEALAEDVRAFLELRVVRAYRVGPIERARKWARRNPAVASTVLAASIACVVGLLAWRWRERAVVLAAEEARTAYLDQVGRAEREIQAGRHDAAAEALAQCGPDRRAFEWSHLSASLDESVTAIELHARGVQGAAWFADGRTIATVTADGSVHVGPPAAPRLVHELGQGAAALDVCAARGLVVVGCEDGTVRALEGPDWTARVVIAGPQSSAKLRAVVAVAADAQGRRVACSWADGSARIVDLGSGTISKLQATDRSSFAKLAFSSDSRRLYGAELVRSGDQPTLLHAWDASSGAEFAHWTTDPCGAPTALDVSPDGRWLAMANGDRRVRLWDLFANAPSGAITGLESHATALDFDARGARLVCGRFDGAIEVRDIGTRERRSLVLGHTGTVSDVRWSPDGTGWSSASADGTLRTWPGVERRAVTTLRGHEFVVTALAWSADGSRIVTAGRDCSVRCWDRATGRSLWTQFAQEQPVFCLAWAWADGLVLSGSGDRTVVALDASTGAVVRRWRGLGKDVSALVVSERRKTLCAAMLDGGLQGIQYLDEGLRDEAWDFGEALTAVALAPREDLLAFGQETGRVLVIDIDGGAEWVAEIPHRGAVRAVSFFPDGRRLASASSDGLVRVWDARSMAILHELRGRDDEILAMAIDPRGERLALAGTAGEILVFETATWRRVLTLSGDWRRTLALAFDPTGRHLASAHDDFAVRIWSADVDLGAFQERARRAAAENRLAVAFGDLRMAHALPEEITRAVRASAAFGTEDQATLEYLALRAGTNPIFLQSLALEITQAPSRDPRRDEQARDWADLAWSLNPNSFDARRARALARLRVGCFEDALETLPAAGDAALALGARCVVTSIRGLARVGLGEIEEARIELRRAYDVAEATGWSLNPKQYGLLSELEAGLALAEAR